MDYVLTHHGILGMKWGKRNGPPYPLDESDKSAREKRLDKNEGGGYNKDKKKDGFHLSDKRKKNGERLADILDELKVLK